MTRKQPDIRIAAASPLARQDALELADLLSSEPHEVLDPAVIERFTRINQTGRLDALMGHLQNLSNAWQPPAPEDSESTNLATPKRPKTTRIIGSVAGARTTVLGATELDPNARGWSEASAPHTRLP